VVWCVCVCVCFVCVVCVYVNMLVSGKKHILMIFTSFILCTENTCFIYILRMFVLSRKRSKLMMFENGILRRNVRPKERY